MNENVLCSLESVRFASNECYRILIGQFFGTCTIVFTRFAGPLVHCFNLCSSVSVRLTRLVLVSFFGTTCGDVFWPDLQLPLHALISPLFAPLGFKKTIRTNRLYPQRVPEWVSKRWRVVFSWECVP